MIGVKINIKLLQHTLIVITILILILVLLNVSSRLKACPINN